MQVVNMSASIQSQSSTRSAQSSSRDGTGGINQPSDVCGQNVSAAKHTGQYPAFKLPIEIEFSDWTIYSINSSLLIKNLLKNNSVKKTKFCFSNI